MDSNNFCYPAAARDMQMPIISKISYEVDGRKLVHTLMMYTSSDF